MSEEFTPPPKCDPATLEALAAEYRAKYPDGFDAALEDARKRRTATGGPIVPAPSRNYKVPGICALCSEPFDSTVIEIEGREILRAIYCETCVQEEQAKSKPKDSRPSPESEWALVCPANYRDTDMLRLRRDMAEKSITLQTVPPRFLAVDELLRYQGREGKGLGIIGRSGARKTRMILERAKRLHFSGVKVRYINAVNFADELAAAYDKGSGGAERWIRTLERSGHLIIDDLGKEKLTERVESTYYRVVEFRQAHKLPLDFTANVKGDGLIEKWQRNAQAQGFFSDRAEPIVRRLREMTEAVIISDR